MQNAFDKTHRSCQTDTISHKNCRSIRVQTSAPVYTKVIYVGATVLFYTVPLKMKKKPYSYDLVLLSPSIHALQNICICEKFQNDNDIVYIQRQYLYALRPKKFKCSFEPIILLSRKKVKFVQAYIRCNQSDDTAVTVNAGNFVVLNR